MRARDRDLFAAEEVPEGFGAVFLGVFDLGAEVRFRPWRGAGVVPLVEDGKGVIVAEVEATNDGASGLVREIVTVLSFDGWPHAAEVASGAGQESGVCRRGLGLSGLADLSVGSCP